jgi:hypothetical protein
MSLLGRKCVVIDSFQDNVADCKLISSLIDVAACRWGA